MTARLASVSRNSEAVSQAGGEADMEAEGGSVLPHVTEIQKNKTFNQQFKIGKPEGCSRFELVKSFP